MATELLRTREDELRDDFEFDMRQRTGGWPTRNSRGEYKKRTTERMWQERLASTRLADGVLGKENTDGR